MGSNIAVDYLRLSVTDCCNLNCLYCRPLCSIYSTDSLPAQKIWRSGADPGCLPHKEELSHKEMFDIVNMLADAGIKKIRITGGEPLLKKDVVDLAGILSGIGEIEEISMTTNGVLLKRFARPLKDAGLCRINISLDTLRKDRYKYITGQDKLNEVLQGIEEALYMKLLPVKLNVVVMKSINDDEIIDFVKLACSKKIIVRFIELFSTGSESCRFLGYFVSNSSIREKIEATFGPLEETDRIEGSGPARYFKVKGVSATIGFIDSTTSNFCHECSRIRMSPEGKLYPCLFSSEYLDLRKCSRMADNLKYVRRFIAEKIYYTKNTVKHRPFEMSMRGG